MYDQPPSIPHLRNLLHHWQRETWANPGEEQRATAAKEVQLLVNELRSHGFTWLDIKDRDYVIAIGVVRHTGLDYCFCNGYDPELLRHYPAGTTIYEILVDLGCFPSRAEAKRNWKRTPAVLPEGYHELDKITRNLGPDRWKANRINLTILVGS